MRSIKAAIAVIILLAGAAVSSCLRPKLKKVNPEFAIPLAYGRLDVADVLARVDSTDLVELNSSGLLALVYEGDVFRLRAKDLLRFRDVNESFVIPSTVDQDPFPAGTTVTIDGSANQNLSIDGVNARFLSAKAGVIDLTVNNSFQNPVNLTVTLTNSSKNGNPLQFNLSVPANATRNQVVSLGGTTVDFGAGNELNIDYAIEIVSEGNPLTSNDALDLDFAFRAVEYRELRFDQYSETVTIPEDSIKLDIFKNSDPLGDNLDFGFQDPSVNITIDNGFALPSEILINKLNAVGDNGVSEPILLQSFPNPFPINAPSTPFEKAFTTDSINSSNSNISAILTPEDKFVSYDFAFRTLPEGGMASVSDQSSLGLRARVNLPLTGYAEGWVISDTLSLTADIEEGDFESANILVNITNQFPVNAELQVYFMDNDGVVLDSLLDGPTQIIPTGTVDPATRRITVAQATHDIGLDADQIANLVKTDKIFIRAELATADAQNQTQVSIYKDYFMEISLGLKAGFVDIFNADKEDEE